jgi:hypothetical protein
MGTSVYAYGCISLSLSLCAKGRGPGGWGGGLAYAYTHMRVCAVARSGNALYNYGQLSGPHSHRSPTRSSVCLSVSVSVSLYACAVCVCMVAVADDLLSRQASRSNSLYRSPVESVVGSYQDPSFFASAERVRRTLGLTSIMAAACVCFRTDAPCRAL